MFCVKCGKELREGVKFCPACGKPVEDTAPNPTSQNYNVTDMEINTNNVTNYSPMYKKDKTIAGLLGVFLGGLGIHKFYMGKYGQGILYLLLCWTYIPAIIGFVEGIVYFTDTDDKFNSRCA